MKAEALCLQIFNVLSEIFPLIRKVMNPYT